MLRLLIIGTGQDHLTLVPRAPATRAPPQHRVDGHDRRVGAPPTARRARLASYQKSLRQYEYFLTIRACGSSTWITILCIHGTSTAPGCNRQRIRYAHYCELPGSVQACTHVPVHAHGCRQGTRTGTRAHVRLPFLLASPGEACRRQRYGIRARPATSQRAGFSKCESITLQVGRPS